MTNEERATELKRLREDYVEAPSVRERKDAVFRAIGLLAFNPSIQFDAKQAADIFTSGQLSQSLTDSMVNRFDMILAQAITELEHPVAEEPAVNLSKSSAAALLPAEPDIPQRLTKEHGFWWFVSHCHWSIKWRLIGGALASAGAILSFGMSLGRNQTVQKVQDALQTNQQSLPNIPPTKPQNTAIPTP